MVCGQPGHAGNAPPEETLLGPLRHPCDLDLLLFFHRHPRVLVTSERLAAYVGHDVKRVGRSLDTLMEAAVLQRSPHPPHEARLYVLSGGANAAWLDIILAAAASDEGRRVLMHALKARAVETEHRSRSGAPPSASRDAGRETEEEKHA